MCSNHTLPGMSYKNDQAFVMNLLRHDNLAEKLFFFPGMSCKAFEIIVIDGFLFKKYH